MIFRLLMLASKIVGGTGALLMVPGYGLTWCGDWLYDRAIIRRSKIRERQKPKSDFVKARRVR